MRTAFSTREVAELLGLSQITVWTWVKSGRLKARRVRRKWLIPVSEVSKISGLKWEELTEKLPLEKRRRK